MNPQLTTATPPFAPRRITGRIPTLWLAVAMVVSLPAAGFVPSNYPPRLVVAVLPFENVTGDAAQDDWREALPALVRTCLGEAEFTSCPRWKKIQPALLQPALLHAGWTSTNAMDASLARQVARELNANVVVWGSFRRQTNEWRVDAKLLRADAESAPVGIQVTAPRWVDLAESVALRLAEQLGRRIADDDRQIWKMNLVSSHEAAGCLAKAITLDTGEAPAAEREAAWRDVLSADPRCGAAHGKLIQILSGAEREGEFDKAVQEFLRQQPRLCTAHVCRAMLLLGTNDGQPVAEAELREALQLHRGCSEAVQLLFQLLGVSKRWTDLSRILEEALASRPDAELARIFLATALVEDGNREDAREVLRSIQDLPEEDAMVDLRLLQAALAAGEAELAGRELVRLGPQAETNELIRSTLESATFSLRGTATGRTNPPVVRPRNFAPGELDAELERRLTVEERQLVVNPLEITPEVTAEAHRLTAGITNGLLRSFALFAEVARRGRGSGDGGQRTAGQALKDLEDPQTRLSCQEYAKLFVALTRALGLEAWLVHIDRCADGSPGYHDCAALFLDGQGLLVDPTWRSFVILHKEFMVLDDVQAISHQAMQPGPKPDPRRLRIGLKLNPDDRWTRLQFVRGMARAGELDAAAEELRKVQSTGAETWDMHETAAVLELARERWQPALAELQSALALSPSNAMVHAKLASVYLQLNDPVKAKRHTETALRLDRGEISAENRREGHAQIALVSAVIQGKTGDRESLDELKRRAEGGELAAQLALAKVCFEAQPARPEEGMRWLLKAAEQGDDNAQFNYAKNLLALRGKDAGDAVVKWLTQSAEQGNLEAQYRLGLFLYEGELVPRDNVAAGQWIVLASSHGSAEAKRLLKEMQLFLTADELAQARKQADTFKPAKKPAATSQP